jgi:hypothetical protein
VLALGIAALVIGVVVAVVVVMLTGSSGAETKNANQPAPAITPTPLPGENPEVKTPVIPPAEHSPAPTERTRAAPLDPRRINTRPDTAESNIDGALTHLKCARGGVRCLI